MRREVEDEEIGWATSEEGAISMRKSVDISPVDEPDGHLMQSHPHSDDIDGDADASIGALQPSD